MKGDFSRSTFDPGKHFSGVRMQQGRVQLDADWNENLDLLRHRIETETIDVIGACGVPVHAPGFGILTDASGLSKEETDWLGEQKVPDLSAGDFYLTQGRAYVDGFLLEYDHTLPFSRQPFVLPAGGGLPANPGLYLLYLDVWERHITALEDPSIREVALGGPDTATRSQVIWQARLAPAVDQGKGTTCSSDLTPWPAASTGTLTAQTTPVQDPNDPCVVPLGAGYKRLENQLYRVEIHNASDAPGGATYKWSRDNGSVAVAISAFAVGGDATKISVTSLGRDDVLGLHKNDWVEILDDAAELAGKPGKLAKINKIDSGNVLELSAAISGFDLNGHPKVRRWDSDGGTGTGLAVVAGYVDLEGGVQVQLDTAGTYHSGDYWLIPARTVPGQFGDIEWPKDVDQNPAALTPFGILHHYCRVALLDFAADHSVTLVEDCRKKFLPLTELPSGGENCCSVTVGQGGDYPDLPSALAARTKDDFGWTICILPGVFSLTDTVAVDAFKGLTFSGCGIYTRLVAPPGKPAFKFTNGSQVTLEGLTIQAPSPSGAVLFSQVYDITIANCRVLNSESTGLTGKWTNKFQPVGPGIVIDGGHQVEIRDNDLIGLPAVQASGTDMEILHNSLMGGGIQIIPPSAFVEIADNTIIDGEGPGIQLGGGNKTAAEYAAVYYQVDKAVSQPAAKKAKAEVYNAIPVTSYAPKTNQIPAATKNVTIARNLIGRMAGSGIITDVSLVDPGQLGDVEGLSIVENNIVFCSLVPDVTLSAASRVGGGIAAIGLFSAQIRDNFIAGSGFGKQAACGIFILDGSDIEIAGNVVVENGSTDNPDKPAFYQAGIAAQLVFGNFLLSGSGAEGGAPLNGYPALRIHDNQVVCPAGQALTVSAIGGVMIDGNTFATRERMIQPANPLDFGVRGSCVYVLDMGVPVWNPNAALLIQSVLAKQTALHVEDFLSSGATLANFPDGRVLFHNNQVWFNTAVKETVKSLGALDGQFAQRAWEAATFSAFFFSLDDLSISSNQFQATVPLYLQDLSQSYTQKGLDLGLFYAYLFKFIQVGALGTTVRATGNGLNELLASNFISLDTLAGLMNVTTSNEATHGIVAFGPNPANTAAANNLSLLP
jgi:hypothetical protein